MSPVWKALRDEEGQSMVESAISLFLMMLMVFVLFEFAMMVYTYSVVFEAVHQGVRYAQVHGYNTGDRSIGCSNVSPTGVISEVRRAAANSLHNMSAMTVTVCYPDSTGSKPLSLVEVSAQYTYVPYVNVPGVQQTISVSSDGRIVY